MIDNEENAKKLIESAIEWRELNRFDIHDQNGFRWQNRKILQLYELRED